MKNEIKTAVVETTIVKTAAEELIEKIKTLPNLSARIRALMVHFESSEPKVKSTMGETTRWLEANGYRTQKGTTIRFQQVRNTWIAQFAKNK